MNRKAQRVGLVVASKQEFVASLRGWRYWAEQVVEHCILPQPINETNESDDVMIDANCTSDDKPNNTIAVVHHESYRNASPTKKNNTHNAFLAVKLHLVGVFHQ